MRIKLSLIAALLLASLAGQSSAHEARQELTQEQATTYLLEQVPILIKNQQLYEKRIELLEAQLELVSALKSNFVCLPSATFNYHLDMIRDIVEGEGFTERYRAHMERQLDIYRKAVRICE